MEQKNLTELQKLGIAISAHYLSLLSSIFERKK